MKKDTINVDKIIKNTNGKRIAVSWPSNEDLPEGVLEGRPTHLRTATSDLEVENEELESKTKAVKAPAKKRVRKAPVKK